MNIVLPKPLNETKETVTLSRADWNALLDQLEDIEDLAAVVAADAHEAEVGKDVARRDYLTAEEVRRLLDLEESPVKIWREKRGLSQRALAEQAGVSSGYLGEIETNRKPGSADALQRLSRVLNVPMEHLVANRLVITVAHLKAFVEKGASPPQAVTEARRILDEWRAIGRRDDHKPRNVDTAVVELRECLRAVAAEYGRKNQPEWDNAMTEIVRRAFA